MECSFKYFVNDRSSDVQMLIGNLAIFTAGAIGTKYPCAQSPTHPARPIAHTSCATEEKFKQTLAHEQLQGVNMRLEELLSQVRALQGDIATNRDQSSTSIENSRCTTSLEQLRIQVDDLCSRAATYSVNDDIGTLACVASAHFVTMQFTSDLRPTLPQARGSQDVTAIEPTELTPDNRRFYGGHPRTLAVCEETLLQRYRQYSVLSSVPIDPVTLNYSIAIAATSAAVYHQLDHPPAWHTPAANSTLLIAEISASDASQDVF